LYITYDVKYNKYSFVASCETCSDTVLSVCSKEEMLGKQLEEEQILNAARTHHKMAGVLALNDGTLFTNMFKGDKETEVLLRLPGAEKLSSRYVK